MIVFPTTRRFHNGIVTVCFTARTEGFVVDTNDTSRYPIGRTSRNWNDVEAKKIDYSPMWIEDNVDGEE